MDITKFEEMLNYRLILRVEKQEPRAFYEVNKDDWRKYGR